MNPDQQSQLPPQPKIKNQVSQPIYGMNPSQSNRPLSKNPSLQLYGSRIPLGESHQRSMASLQSMESSEAVFSQLIQTQTFSIFYNNSIFMVDPNLLSSSSAKFKELIDPFLKTGQSLNNVRLNIADNVFTNRNMENFLKLCQNLPTDVQDDEMKEVCEIAKMFGSDQIYNTGLKFIQTSLDPAFNVPDNKYDGSDGKNYLYITVIQPSNTQESNESINSVIYVIKIENRALKCPIYRFLSNNKLLFSAKRKYYDVFFVEGEDVHIEKNKEKHIGQIHQHTDGYNMIRARDWKFKLVYVNSGKPDELSIEVDFPFKGGRVKWTPKIPVFDSSKNKYYLNFAGNYHRTPMKSSKNIVLQNSNGHSTFILRKMAQNVYEVECVPEIDPLIIFEIGISDIIGPYTV
ncbi:hypothetical protein M9Y10_024654 [Tritrichomonas musculus]|uniref:BTB domain-containing protein n=1 Tax=Tritrichomonas musculus TaxID=1915356 RepID=A0ABR2HAV6_9EUKA